MVNKFQAGVALEYQVLLNYKLLAISFVNRNRIIIETKKQFSGIYAVDYACKGGF